MEKGKIVINYEYPKLHRRIFALIIDLILMMFAFFSIFVSIRGIMNHTDRYPSAMQNVEKTRLDSGIYIRDDSGNLVDVVSLYKNDEDLSDSQKQTYYTRAIDSFISYVRTELGDQKAQEVENDYYSYLLNDDLTYDGVTYFIDNGNGVPSINPICQASIDEYNQNVYIKYIDSDVQAYLNSLFSQYNEDVQYLFTILFYIEIPISAIIGGILVFYVPGLFFKRGRQTLGKALYRIGLVDSHYLSVKLGRYTANWAISFFVIFILSFLTMGIPLLISFSLMAFSKKKQTFSEYMLGIQEVSMEKQKIYYSKTEIRADSIAANKKAIDFASEEKVHL
ncbi:MAG: RDD family protein [Bacilli bacterium]|nr:RDD family protein [Bacilli bacterium]